MAKKIYGLIGHPVGHSLSPAMHNAAFKALAIDAEYLLYDVAPDSLEDFLGGVRQKNIAGFNVTIPHKITVKNYLEHNGILDENARRLGAVNTVSVSEKDLCGFNTDGPGFYRSLVEDLGFEPEGKNIFVLGAGGAATAAVMYLGSSPRKIFVSDIDGKKAGNLKSHYERHYAAGRLVIVEEKEIETALGKSDLLVNATPAGMNEADPSPVAKRFLHRGLYVYDLVYNRIFTRLVRDASEMKLHAVTGAGMLLHQAALAFCIWTGKKAPLGIMKKALREALKRCGNG